MGRKRSISRKITFLLLAMVLAALLLSGELSMWGMHSVRKVSVENSRELGKTAAEDAESALEIMAGKQLVNTVVEKAAYIEEKFAAVTAYVHGIVSLAEDIYAAPEEYQDREVAPPKKGGRNLAAQLLRSAKLGEPTPQQWEEIQKLGNIQDLLVQYNRNNDMVSSTYLATESGWMIQADYIAYSKYSENASEPDSYEADTRQWYQRALQAKEGETVYTDVIEDVHEGGKCIVCAQPVYLEGKIVAVAGVGSYLDTVEEAVLGTGIGERGYAFLVNQKGQVMISPKKEGETAAYARQAVDLRQSGNKELAEIAEKMLDGGSGLEKLTLDGREVCLAYAPLESLGWSFAAVLDLEEVAAPAKESQALILGLTEEAAEKQDAAIRKALIFFGVLFFVAAVLICLVGTLFSRRIVSPIGKLTAEVVGMDGGNLDRRVEIHTGDELEELGNAFNHMTAQIQKYVGNLAAMTAEKERIRTEIEVASRLQADMLPEPEGAFRDRQEFSLYASMTPAKGVGGDFYDFFQPDENHLALVMADVSGKGVPAALFMVVARTLIRSHMAVSGSLAQAVEEINDSLCANNKNGMFVTAWIGLLDITTGKLVFVNAGHCRPLIRHRDGSCTYETTLSGFVLAGMEETRYHQSELYLHRGDTLLLYTDGVTEATSVGKELFGEDRLQEAVLDAGDAGPKKLLQKIWQDVDSFQQGAEQFDDITMLALSYRGKDYRDKTGEPKIENIKEFADFVEKALTEYGITDKTTVKVKMALDEIFSNICYYSGAEQVTVGVGINSDSPQAADTYADDSGLAEGSAEVILYFEDDGIPYDPLRKQDPDVEELLENRKTGGLGIYLVKKRMDKMEYEYTEGRNRLTLKKRDA